MVEWNEWEEKERELSKHLEEMKKRKRVQQPIQKAEDVREAKDCVDRALIQWNAYGKTDLAWEEAERMLIPLKKKAGIE